MPKPKTKTEYPENIRPYVFHGLSLVKDGKNWVGECPFCGRENKLGILEETGQGRCFVCQISNGDGDGFNVYGFLKLLHTSSVDATTNSDFADFAREKGIARMESLVSWGLCRSIIGYSNWLLPAYSHDGTLTQLYSMVPQSSGKSVMIPTPSLKLKMLGVDLFNDKLETVYVCEGYKDSIRLWESLRSFKMSDGECVPTGNVSASLAADANVLGIPGLGFIGKEQLNPYHRFFSGKRVVLCFDSDHPKELNGRIIPPAGFSAVSRMAKILSAMNSPPVSIEYLHWGDEGYDPERKPGFDVSDLLAH